MSRRYELMNAIKQSFLAVKYHKYVSSCFFVLFSALLLMATFLSQLIFTQKIMLNYIDNKWAYFHSVSPNVTTTIQEELIHQINLLSHHSIKYAKLLMIVSTVGFYIFSIVIAKIRKNDIHAMFNMGVNKHNIIKLLLSDLFIPIGISLLVCVSFLLVCQEQFVQMSVNVNQKMIQQHVKQPEFIIEQTDNHTTQKKPTEEKVLLPFNQLTLMDSNFGTSDTVRLVQLIGINFSAMLLSCLFGSFLGFYTYSSKYSYRRMM